MPISEDNKNAIAKAVENKMIDRGIVGQITIEFSDVPPPSDDDDEQRACCIRTVNGKRVVQCPCQS